MIDGLVALERATAEFDRRLRLVGTADWTRSTPCTEWDVRALVNHVIGGNRRYVMLLHGAAPDEVDATRSRDHLGDDAVAAFGSTAAKMADAFREDGALARVAHHPVGDRTGAELLGMRIYDLVVHAWDLARGIGADEALDPDATTFALLHAAGRKGGDQP